MEEKKSVSAAQKRATQKYLSQFIDLKIRVTPKGHDVITQHAQSQGESTAAFIRRAIFETMERDNAARNEETTEAPSSPAEPPDIPMPPEAESAEKREDNSFTGILKKRFGIN